MNVAYQHQRFNDDCGITAISMATGIGYDEVRSAFGANAINETDFQEWCAAHDYAWQTVYQFQFGENRHFRKRSPWPPKPWAPMHVFQCRATGELHFAVMDAAGNVFDPWSEDRKTITHPDYREVHWVMGLFKINP